MHCANSRRFFRPKSASGCRRPPSPRLRRVTPRSLRPARREGVQMPLVMDATACRARWPASPTRSSSATAAWRSWRWSASAPAACRWRGGWPRGCNEIAGDEVPAGALDITLYRDDLMRHAVGPQPVVRRTEIPFSIDDRRILLVDDVLYTGRTIRAALDALIDFGRPRAHPAGRAGRPRPPRAADQGRLRRQEPADLAQQSVQVRLQEIDGVDEVSIEGEHDATPSTRPAPERGA